MGVVKANQRSSRELQAKEEKEIDRILAELSAEAASFREDISLDYDLLIRLDTIFARGKLSVRMGAMEPALSRKHLFFRRARHPLLDPKTAVANDLGLGDTYDTLVITGPNTGGKTVTLKTIGLLTLMAQCGLHIPVSDDSRVKVFRRVLADVGDEQSIAQSLSTFSSHMVNIVGILGEADDETLILFDELGAGTDPIEGAALAAAIIESAREMGGPGGRHHPLRRAEGVRHDHAGGRERLLRVQCGHPGPHLPAAHRRAGQVQRLCHLGAAGPAQVHHPEGRRPH